jgi:hypothetical protein
MAFVNSVMALYQTNFGILTNVKTFKNINSLTFPNEFRLNSILGVWPAYFISSRFSSFIFKLFNNTLGTF